VQFLATPQRTQDINDHLATKRRIFRRCRKSGFVAQQSTTAASQAAPIGRIWDLGPNPFCCFCYPIATIATTYRKKVRNSLSWPFDLNRNSDSGTATTKTTRKLGF